jgi:DNA repair exonuclease SbcCD ATPase subunit
MKIQSLVIENFMGVVGIHRVDWATMGLVHIAGRNLDDPGNDSNGAGKSTLLEAMTWCLFGEGLPRPQGNSEQGARADEVLNDRLGKQCKVDVTLQDDEGTYRVVRWRKWKDVGEARTNGVQLIAKGQTTQALDEDETNRQITQTLGITHDIWCRGVVFGQESGFNFCDATAMQRQDILTTVLGLEVVDAWHEKCRDEKRALTNRMAESGGMVAVHKAALERDQRENPQAAVEQWEAQRAAKLKDLDDQAVACEVSGKALVAALKVLPPLPPQVTPPAIPPWVELPEPQENPALRESWNEASSREHDCLAEDRAAYATMERARVALEGLQVFNQGAAVCPTCQQAITVAHKAKCENEAAMHLLRLTEVRNVTAAEYAKAKTALAAEPGPAAELARVKAEREMIARARNEHFAQVEKANQSWREGEIAREAEVRKRADLEAKVERERGVWVQVDARRAQLRAENNPYLAFVAAHQAKLAQLATDLAAAEKEQVEIGAALDVCLWWDKELPRFKTWMFDSVVDTLAAEANRWLKVMSGGVIWIQITTQKEVGKRLKDEIDVQIYRWNPDGSVVCRPYRLWSGGEKRRVGLAVDLGLSRLLASRASKAYRFLALDEIDRHLDDKGKEGLRMVLDELRAEKDTVATISHDPEFKASFDSEIVVTRQAGQTRMEIHAQR